MKAVKWYLLAVMILLVSKVSMAQLKIVLPGVCATCPTTPSNPLGEPAPCDGLKDAQDFSGLGSAWNRNPGHRISGFISKAETVYVGWLNTEYNNTVTGIAAGTEYCLQGTAPPFSTTAAVSSDDLQSMYTAIPAVNVLLDAPGETFKVIQKNAGGFFILSDQGRIYNWGYTNSGPGGALGAVCGPASTTISASINNVDCSVLQKLRQIPHPQGKKWKAMQIGIYIGYAADEDGKWWAWGQGARILFPSSSVPQPAVGQSWAYMS
ncbi:hypothetical protein [Arsenicibacter rosenii]|uniref:Uncharacterized protein n=1 Tax=Arsenicibacter rosenii TaxID=1750698 RepID=A0A1S2VJ26_9BACT|nr:hypothetical protein [Arsenicibacter rosenii]OIN58752.1 hypothetical protein BLX24_14455 [Arsenicibacter rosenii]